MNIRKLLFIYNPVSGRGIIHESLSDILMVFAGEGYLAGVYRTQMPGDAGKLAREEGPNVELIIAAGGDGTLNEVVSGVMMLPEEQRPRIGFIPVGSTNDTKTSYDLPDNIAEAAQTALNGVPFRTDIGATSSGSYFAYVCSFGELSAVSCFTPRSAKSVFGRAAYIGEGLKALLKMEAEHVTVTYDGGQVEGDYILGMVANAKAVGGFPGIMGMDVDLQDGMFEVILIKKPKDLRDLQREVSRTLIFPEDGLDDPDDPVFRFKTRKVTFTSADREIQWVVDGEDAGRHKVLEIENCHQAVEIMAGRSFAGS